MITLWIISLCAAYLLCGLLFTLAYIYNYNTEPGEAKLGLLTLFWLPMLILELVLAVAYGIGTQVKTFAKAMGRKHAARVARTS